VSLPAARTKRSADIDILWTNRMTRIVAMSDTHMLHRMLTVPDGDIVVHSGDWTSEGHLGEYDDFFAWFSALPHVHKILVAGNHESVMEEFGKLMRRRIPKNVTYLQDEAAVVAGMKFWGSPRTPGYRWMAFTHRAIEHPESVWAMIPEDIDVLVTHGPPYGILDRNSSGQHIGDRELLKRVHIVRPRLHLFGHVHDDNGETGKDGIRFVNAAVGDDDKEPNLSAKLHVLDVASSPQQPEMKI
jgi:predicted phosphohydrolase